MTDIPEMVERVARVIYDARNGNGMCPARAADIPDWATEGARLAIEAMREPTSVMKDAGRAMEEKVLGPKFGLAFHATYLVMINTALK